MRMLRLLPLLTLLAPAVAAATPKPIDMTFRWAATPLTCQWRGQTRSNGPACSAVTAPYVVTATAPSKGAPRIGVTRHTGDKATSPAKWTRDVDLGPAAGVPVVLLHADTVFVAAVSGGSVFLAALEASTGKLVNRIEVFDTKGGFKKDATGVQLAATDNLTVYALGTKDAWVASLDYKLAVTGTALVALSAVRTKMVKGHETAAIASDAGGLSGGGASAIHKKGNYVVTRGGQTIEVPQAIGEQISLHVMRDRTILVGHSDIASGAEACALDAKTGATKWRRAVSGLGPVAHSKYHNRVITLVDSSSGMGRDLLVVQGIESHGAYICTIDVARGIEHACVDRLDPKDVLP